MAWVRIPTMHSGPLQQILPPGRLFSSCSLCLLWCNTVGGKDCLFPWPYCWYCLLYTCWLTFPRTFSSAFVLIMISRLKTSYGFSGHASTSFAVTTLVFLFLRKNKGWLSMLFIWPLLFSFSRIYVGVHFPSDLLVGAFVGTLLAFGAYWFSKRLIVSGSR